VRRKFNGRNVKLKEFTDQQDDPIYLRRYQANEQQYRDLAKTHGLTGNYFLFEWAMLEKQNYLCRPMAV
jgi:hypothetical protein